MVNKLSQKTKGAVGAAPFSEYRLERTPGILADAVHPCNWGMPIIKAFLRCQARTYAKPTRLVNKL